MYIPILKIFKTVKDFYIEQLRILTIVKLTTAIHSNYECHHSGSRRTLNCCLEEHNESYYNYSSSTVKYSVCAMFKHSVFDMQTHSLPDDDRIVETHSCVTCIRRVVSNTRIRARMNNFIYNTNKCTNLKMYTFTYCIVH